MHYSLATCEPWHDTALITLAWEMGSQTEKLPLQLSVMVKMHWYTAPCVPFDNFHGFLMVFDCGKEIESKASDHDDVAADNADG
jgi:hypothetical protein